MSTRRKSGRTPPLRSESWRLLVFADLDRELREPHTFDWRAAASTVAALRRQDIPFILCTSKTRAEVEPLREKIGHHDPYIAENGGILVLPWEFLGKQIMRGLKARDVAVQLGWNHAEVVRALSKVARLAKVEVRSFHEMSAEEVARTTGLALGDARRAHQREASEPFEFVDADHGQIQDFRRSAREHGMEMAEGERFWQLTAGTDRGQAMGLVSCLYEILEGVRARTIAVGGSIIDLPMLKRADLPVLVARPGGKFDSRVIRALPHVMRMGSVGPGVWAQAVRIAVLQYSRDFLSGIRRTRRVGLAGGRQAPALRGVSLSPAPAARRKPRASRKTAA